MPESASHPQSNSLEYFLRLDPPELASDESVKALALDVRFVFGAMATTADYDERHDLHGLRIPTGTVYAVDLSTHDEQYAQSFMEVCNAATPNKNDKKSFQSAVKSLREGANTDFERRILERFAGREVGKLIAIGEYSDVADELKETAIPDPEIKHFITDGTARYDRNLSRFRPIPLEHAAANIEFKVSQIESLARRYADRQTAYDHEFTNKVLSYIATDEGVFADSDEVNIWATHFYAALPKLFRAQVAPNSIVDVEKISSEYPMLPIFELSMRTRFGLESSRELKLRSLLQVCTSDFLYSRLNWTLTDINLTTAVVAHIVNLPDADHLEDLCNHIDSTGTVEYFLEYLRKEKNIDLDKTSVKVSGKRARTTKEDVHHVIRGLAATVKARNSR